MNKFAEMKMVNSKQKKYLARFNACVDDIDKELSNGIHFLNFSVNDYKGKISIVVQGYEANNFTESMEIRVNDNLEAKLMTKGPYSAKECLEIMIYVEKTIGNM